MDPFSQIEINPEIRFGKPCIKGTRISVEDILQKLESRLTTQQIINDFPQLTEENIKAAIYYAANRESIIDIVKELPKPAIDVSGDLIKRYYESRFGVKKTKEE